MAVRCVESDLDNLLGLNVQRLVSSTSSLKTVRLLQHCQSFAAVTLGDCTVQQVMGNYVAQSAWEQPYVMHMLLAVSSAHMKRLALASSTPKSRQILAMAEAKHWQHGLSLYRAALATPATRNQQDIDALISTTFLSVIFTFALEDRVDAHSFETDFDKSVNHALTPMAAGSGIIALGQVTGIQTSIAWMPVLRNSNDRKGTYTSQSSCIEGVSPTILQFCGVNEHSTAVNNEYYRILQMLGPLLQLERGIRHFTKLVAFGGRSVHLFRPLLQKRDPKALLLLSYWFALLRQLDQWWLNIRVRSTCCAIVTYLRTIADPTMHALLSFPASCGDGVLDQYNDL